MCYDGKVLKIECVHIQDLNEKIVPKNCICDMVIRVIENITRN